MTTIHGFVVEFKEKADVLCFSVMFVSSIFFVTQKAPFIDFRILVEILPRAFASYLVNFLKVSAKGAGRERVTFYHSLWCSSQKGASGRGASSRARSTRGPQSIDLLFGCGEKSSVGCRFLEIRSSGGCWCLAPARCYRLDGFSFVVRGS